MRNVLYGGHISSSEFKPGLAAHTVAAERVVLGVEAKAINQAKK